MTKANNKVAVIGAGIIGLYVAYKLQKKGCQVTVFEKKRAVGSKPCSALISERIKESLPISDNLYEKKVSSVLVHFRKKDIYLKVSPCFLHFDRQKLDEFVFELAKKEGVSFFFNKEMEDLPEGFDKIIICSGALYRKEEKSFRLGVQYFVKKTLDNKQIEIWPFQGENYGFLWKIPKDKVIEYGGIGSVKDTLVRLRAFLRQEEIVFDQKNLKAALIPQGLCSSKDKNVFVLGDAAGLTKPTTGGGVIWGIKAADILIDNFSDFKKAEKEINRFFKLRVLKGKLAVRLGYFAGKYLFFLLPKKVKIDADLY